MVPPDSGFPAPDTSRLGPRRLQGVRVVDASTFISGPVAGRALADLGAEVLKVEPPTGDPFRRMAPLMGGLGTSYIESNLGKSVLTIDLKDPAGVKRLSAELAEADVLITNWRPGVAERLGLTPALVGQLNPALLWCRISGLGQDGPEAQAPAFDTIIQGRSGITFTQGDGGQPAMVRTYLVDKVTAMMATNNILAALVEREKGSRAGGVIDVSMLDSISWFDSFDVLAQRVDPAQEGNQVNTTLQNIRPVRTSDGWILVAPARMRQITGTFAAVGHPEWIERLKGLDPDAMSRSVYDWLESETPSRSSEYWIEALARHDVPASRVLDLDQHLADPQVVHNGIYVEVDHPEVGRVRAARWPGCLPGTEDRRRP